MRMKGIGWWLWEERKRWTSALTKHLPCPRHWDTGSTETQACHLIQRKELDLLRWMESESTLPEENIFQTEGIIYKQRCWCIKQYGRIMILKRRTREQEWSVSHLLAGTRNTWLIKWPFSVFLGRKEWWRQMCWLNRLIKEEESWATFRAVGKNLDPSPAINVLQVEEKWGAQVALAQSFWVHSTSLKP